MSSTSTRSSRRWRRASATSPTHRRARTARRPAEKGYLHCGPVGAGHFVKMVHNGIEYGMMQAYAEGFDILRKPTSNEAAGRQRYELNIADIAEVWRRGSVVSSWLLDFTAMALAEDPTLSRYSRLCRGSGEGRWTVMLRSRRPSGGGLRRRCIARFRSRKSASFAEKCSRRCEQVRRAHRTAEAGRCSH